MLSLAVSDRLPYPEGGHRSPSGDREPKSGGPSFVALAVAEGNVGPGRVPGQRSLFLGCGSEPSFPNRQQGKGSREVTFLSPFREEAHCLDAASLSRLLSVPACV